ncbi:MAG: GNAT family N-acetyltransferase [Patescibacteria group bacterium]|nr:GNAT family N-acetyltransferase [Patescibacteria group bacterium]
MKLLIKSGQKLTDPEFLQIKESHFREFKDGPNKKEDLINHIFFLLKNKKKILALGALIPISFISFNAEKFSVLGIGGIVANIKRKGYGKKIMTAIRKYLTIKNITGVGFCGEYNVPFYKKCGFKTDKNSIKQFIYYKNDKRIPNTMNDHVVYLDGKDDFMQKVLFHPETDIVLPRPPNW